MISLEEQLVKLLFERNMTVSTAESCTGGLIAANIINSPGASNVYNEGFITYANEAKEKYLGVKAETLEKYGAVSRETVEEMARGCAERTGADITIVSSGLAGPGGGTEIKPVGLVYVACCYEDNVKVEKYMFHGDRQEIRNQTVQAALQLAIDIING